MKDILNVLKLVSRQRVHYKILNPLRKMNLVSMTDKSIHSKNQKYKLTSLGKKLAKKIEEDNE